MTLLRALQTSNPALVSWGVCEELGQTVNVQAPCHALRPELLTILGTSGEMGLPQWVQVVVRVSRVFPEMLSCGQSLPPRRAWKLTRGADMAQEAQTEQAEARGRSSGST